MKSLLRSLRQTPAINKPVARLLKLTGIKSLQNRWPIAGNYRLQFHGIPFQNYLRCDDHIANALFYGNPWEAEELDLFLDYARRSRVILDIGANTGIYSILSSRVNREATIHAFEPNAYNFGRLQRNAALNAPHHIRLNQLAVGDSLEPLTFAVPTKDIISYTSSANIAFSENTHTGELEWKKVQVGQETVDHYCDSHHTGKVDLMKIDVEGFEQVVFRGARETLKRDRPVVICEIYFTPEIQEFFRGLLDDCQYRMVSIGGQHNGQDLDLTSPLPDGLGNNYVFLPIS